MNLKDLSLGQVLVIASTLKGKVLWVSEKDGNGIIVSGSKEFYFDTSTCEIFKDLKRGDSVVFDMAKVDNINCAKKVVKAGINVIPVKPQVPEEMRELSESVEETAIDSFSSMSKAQQAKYIKDHPHSKHAHTIPSKKDLKGLSTSEHVDKEGYHMKMKEAAHKAGDKESAVFHDMLTDMHNQLRRVKQYDADRKSPYYSVKNNKGSLREDAVKARNKFENLHKELKTANMDETLAKPIPEVVNKIQELELKLHKGLTSHTLSLKEENELKLKLKELNKQIDDGTK